MLPPLPLRELHLSDAGAGPRMVVLISLPGGHLRDAWVAKDTPDRSFDVASRLGALLQAHHQLLGVLSAPHDESWTVVEASHTLALVRQFRIDFALGGIFSSEATQGAARLTMRRLIKHLGSLLPSEQPIEVEI